MTIKVDWVPGLKLADVNVGDVLICDDGFTCVPAGQLVGVFADRNDTLCFACGDGEHTLDGQLNIDGTLAGLMRAPAAVEIVAAPTKLTTKGHPATAAARAQTIITLIADHTGCDRDKASDLDAMLVDDLGADSLDGIELEMAIEEELDLPSDTMEDAIKKHWRVRDVIDAVEKALAS
jgi:acyl carrier protein